MTNRTFRHLSCLTVLALLLTSASASFAVPITTPSGLNAGDQYRLVFVTSTTRDATSSNIADYNAFVTAAANLSSELVALSTTWTAIGSTATVDARDNTGTNPTTDGTGVGIYNLQDDLVANNNADLWDASIGVPVNYDEMGVVVTFCCTRTGSMTDGTKDLSNSLAYLGTASENVEWGLPGASSGDWVAFGNSDKTQSMTFYGVSDVLTVVPEPGTGMLVAMGMLAMSVGRRRRKA